MVKSNRVTRNLIGAGGVRLFDVPGLVYPPEMLVARPPEMDEALTEVPPWGITIEQAAVILHCLPSSARILLNKAGVEKCKVKLPGCNACYYWRKTEVETVASARPQEFSAVPESYMLANDAVAYLKVSRSTLNRYVRYGIISCFRVRFREASGAIRLQHLFRISDIHQLHRHRNALHAGACHVPLNSYLSLKSASESANNPLPGPTAACRI